MGDIVEILDYEERTERAIPLLSRRCPEFELWCKQLAQKLQGFERIFWGLMRDLDIEKANLEQLEQIGNILLESRSDRDIEEYRVILSGKWAVLKSSGHPEELMDICENLLFARRAVWYGAEDYVDLVNVLFAEMDSCPDFTKLPYVLKEMRRSKRGGQDIQVNIVEVEHLLLIPEDENDEETCYLIPENESEKDDMTLHFNIEEVI